MKGLTDRFCNSHPYPIIWGSSLQELNGNPSFLYGLEKLPTPSSRTPRRHIWISKDFLEQGFGEKNHSFKSRVDREEANEIPVRGQCDKVAFLHCSNDGLSTRKEKWRFVSWQIRSSYSWKEKKMLRSVHRVLLQSLRKNGKPHHTGFSQIMKAVWPGEEIHVCIQIYRRLQWRDKNTSGVNPRSGPSHLITT